MMLAHPFPCGAPSASRSASNAAAEAVYATGHWLYERARYADAATVFRALVRVAPADERGWVALACCHQAVEQDVIALEMLGTGCLLAAPAPRCELARARALRALGRIDEADDALDAAADAAEARGNEDVLDLVRAERRRA